MAEVEQLNLQVEYTITMMMGDEPQDFVEKYGSDCHPGNLNFSDGVSCGVILQKCQVQGQELAFNYQHGNIHKPYIITTFSDDQEFCVLPNYKESLQSYLKRNKDKHVYTIVSMKKYNRLGRRISFSEEFKSRLLEIFKGIKAIHDEGHTHGSISGTTMIICAIGPIHIGRVVGMSLGPSGDPKKDWKDVADFLKELHPDKFNRSSPFDSEILDLIDLLYNRNNNLTDELVIEHIALWLAPKKRALINIIQDSIFGSQIKLTKMNTIEGDFKWQYKIDTEIKNTIINKHKNKYTTDVLGLVKFIRNMIEHGHTEFARIENKLSDTFEYNEKGILGMIDKTFPRLFINILNEAKAAGLSIPKY